MNPGNRWSADPPVTELYLTTARAAEELLARREVADRWTHDSALRGYTVGGLAGHLARAVLVVPQYLDQPATTSGAPVDAAGYFAVVLGDHDPLTSPMHEAVRARADEAASAGAADLVERVARTRSRLEASLTDEVVAGHVTVKDGLVMTVGDYLGTRLTELVVHVDDLAVSLDLPVPGAIPDAAFTCVAAILGRLAALRTGGIQTVRGLARAERHPDPIRAM